MIEDNSYSTNQGDQPKNREADADKAVHLIF